MNRPGEDLPFGHLEPVWQLRVGEYRVFYDVAGREEETRSGRRVAGGKKK